MQQFIEFGLRHWELIAAFVVVFILVIIFEIYGQMAGLKQLSTHAATLLINKQDAVVVDIRDKESFAQGHIAQAINIPLTDLEAKQKQLDKYKNKPIILVCTMGQSTTKAAAFLNKNGFTQVQALKGGINAWQSANLPLTKT